MKNILNILYILGNDENQTRGCLVRSAKANSPLHRPQKFRQLCSLPLSQIAFNAEGDVTHFKTLFRANKRNQRGLNAPKFAPNFSGFRSRNLFGRKSSEQQLLLFSDILLTPISFPANCDARNKLMASNQEQGPSKAFVKISFPQRYIASIPAIVP